MRWLLVICLIAMTAAPLAQAPGAYRVGPKDVLDITVWGHAEISNKFTVSPEGSITFPLIGSIVVKDRTTDDIESELVKLLADGYFVKPQVNVEVAQFLSKRLYVIGEVRTQGPIPLTASVTLLEALARAGSMTEQAGGEVLVLRRTAGQPTLGPLTTGQEGVTELGRVSVQQVRSGSVSVDVPLQDGDTIFVPRAELVHVLGYVNSPGPYPLEPGMTVSTAIALAGGVSQIGSTNRVTIKRIVNGKVTELKVNSNELLKPADQIYVGARLI